jgi:hypothetical protein
MLSRATFPALALTVAGALTLAAGAAASAPKAPHPAALAPGAAAPAPTSHAGVDGIPPGYVRADSGTLTAPTGTQTRGSVSCPAGTVVFGGSVFVFSPSLLVNVNSTFPQLNGWAADINNASGASATFDVTVICGFQPKNYSVQSTTGANPSGSQTTAKATCPTGSQPLSGGALSSSVSPFVNMTSTFPQRRTWRVVESNASASSASVTAFAICGKLAGYTVEDPGFDLPVAAGAQSLVSVTCPDSTLAIGGGVHTNSTSVGVTINATWIDGRNWNELINDNSGVSFSARPIAVCAGTLP